jgi:virginiamycin A acetyltransferase
MTAFCVCYNRLSESFLAEVSFMKNGKTPDPNVIHPVEGYDREIYVKPTVRNPNIVVGDFTYIADSEFESHVTHFYPWSRDRLIIGKFCQIASGVEFVMNDANHQMNAVSTFPFYTLEGWDMAPPDRSDLPLRGDTVIGNDVWIGQNAVILTGVRIGDGAIIGANSVVGKDVEPYTIVAGNPAKVLRKRFDDELIDLLLAFKWWDKEIEEVNALIPLLTCSDLEKVKSKLKARPQPSANEGEEGKDANGNKVGRDFL